MKTAGNTTNLRFHLTRSHPDSLDMQLKKDNIGSEDEVQAATTSKRRKITVVIFI